MSKLLNIELQKTYRDPGSDNPRSGAGPDWIRDPAVPFLVTYVLMFFLLNASGLVNGEEDKSCRSFLQ